MISPARYQRTAPDRTASHNNGCRYTQFSTCPIRHAPAPGLIANSAETSRLKYSATPGVPCAPWKTSLSAASPNASSSTARKARHSSWIVSSFTISSAIIARSERSNFANSSLAFAGTTTGAGSETTKCLGDTYIRLIILTICLLYTSDAADEEDSVDLGGRRIIK